MTEDIHIRLGGTLLDAAEAHFRTAGCTHVALQIGRDNEAARAFYQRRGFASGMVSNW